MSNSLTKGHYIFCTYYTRKDGVRIYAKDYGLKAWRIYIRK